MAERETATPTSTRGIEVRGREGRIAGYVLKLLRESTGTTQDGLAEHLGVDATTVQSWEAGRRPLSAMPAGSYLTLRRRLLRLGVRPAYLPTLDAALDADQFIGYVLATGPAEIDIESHPLAVQVSTRAFSEMVSWPLTSVAPGALRNMSSGVARRGPVAQKPVLDPGERLHIVGHLKQIAELAVGDREDELLVRRQACYLAGFDQSASTTEWLKKVGQVVRRRPPKGGGWSPTWAAERSIASGMARHGDRNALRHFIATQIADEVTETANLNYWAYWVGEITEPKLSDTFMIETSPESWYARS